MTWYSKGARLFVLVLSLSLVILSGPVFAQANEEKAELAEKIINLHREEGYLERALQAAIQNVPTGQKAAMEKAISRLDQDAIYAGWTEKVDETYTIEEMKAVVSGIFRTFGFGLVADLVRRTSSAASVGLCSCSAWWTTWCRRCASTWPQPG